MRPQTSWRKRLPRMEQTRRISQHRLLTVKQRPALSLPQMRLKVQVRQVPIQFLLEQLSITQKVAVFCTGTGTVPTWQEPRKSLRATRQRRRISRSVPGAVEWRRPPLNKSRHCKNIYMPGSFITVPASCQDGSNDCNRLYFHKGILWQRYNGNRRTSRTFLLKECAVYFVHCCKITHIP